jgi:hypothetical protein
MKECRFPHKTGLGNRLPHFASAGPPTLATTPCFCPNAASAPFPSGAPGASVAQQSADDILPFLSTMSKKKGGGNEVAADTNPSPDVAFQHFQSECASADRGRLAIAQRILESPVPPLL